MLIDPPGGSQYPELIIRGYIIFDIADIQLVVARPMCPQIVHFGRRNDAVLVATQQVCSMLQRSIAKATAQKSGIGKPGRPPLGYDPFRKGSDAEQQNHDAAG